MQSAQGSEDLVSLGILLGSPECHEAAPLENTDFLLNPTESLYLPVGGLQGELAQNGYPQASLFFAVYEQNPHPG